MTWKLLTAVIVCNYCFLTKFFFKFARSFCPLKYFYLTFYIITEAILKLIHSNPISEL